MGGACLASGGLAPFLWRCSRREEGGVRPRDGGDACVRSDDGGEVSKLLSLFCMPAFDRSKIRIFGRFFRRVVCESLACSTRGGRPLRAVSHELSDKVPTVDCAAITRVFAAVEVGRNLEHRVSQFPILGLACVCLQAAYLHRAQIR